MNQSLESTNAAATPGERLKQAREQAGLSVERVAKDLYLDAHVINSIESNSFKDLGAPVYAKGYLRKYARLVGVAEEDVLRRYQSLGDAPTVADPIPAAMGTVAESRRPLPRGVWWTVIGLIVLAAVATLWNMRSPNSVVSDQGQLISQPLTAPGSITAAGDSSSGQTTTNAARVSLRFAFAGDSWVEVYDVNNQKVLDEMGSANGVREIAASPPLRVVLGAANVVSMQVNSQAVPVPATHIDAGVARFTVNANGALE